MPDRRPAVHPWYDGAHERGNGVASAPPEDCANHSPCREALGLPDSASGGRSHLQTNTQTAETAPGSVETRSVDCSSRSWLVLTAELNPDELLNADLKRVNASRAHNLDRLAHETRCFLRRRQRQPHIVRGYFHAPHVRYANM